jgi:hypothetical protein
MGRFQIAVQVKVSEVGRDRRARRGSRNGFYTKIAKSCWCFCYQRQKQSLLGSLLRADTGLFVSFATIPVLHSFSEGGCKIVLEGLGAPGGRALPTVILTEHITLT